MHSARCLLLKGRRLRPLPSIHVKDKTMDSRHERSGNAVMRSAVNQLHAQCLDMHVTNANDREDDRHAHT